MPAQPKYYHARKIDAQPSGFSPAESGIEGSFSAFHYFLRRCAASRLKKRSVMPAM